MWQVTRIFRSLNLKMKTSSIQRTDFAFLNYCHLSLCQSIGSNEEQTISLSDKQVITKDIIKSVFKESSAIQKNKFITA